MSEKKPLYITTTLPYVNADPHIGFALEIVQADVLARAKRAQGIPVFFSTGTDEHGQKIQQKAALEDKAVQDYVDYFSGEVRKLQTALDLSCDNFIRTTDESHIVAAQALWNRCLAKGDIYKKKYTGLYCVGDEAFIKESDLINGMCPHHPVPPIEIEEENYFFKFSAYQKQLEEYLSHTGVIIPEWRRQEAINFLAKGLEDFSISREISRMSWGIPVPGDDSQVMYVWFDALTSYISTLGWPTDEAEGTFDRFWRHGHTLQVAGKDQIRFQSLMWQAMLLSADIKNTDQVFYHGFITSGDQKMSKSVGNVISPYELVSRYGTDATRYLLLRHIHPTEDTDITWERLNEWYTANMVNGLGNLVARVMKLAESNLAAPVQLDQHDSTTFSEFYSSIEEFSFNNALDHIFKIIGECDGIMTEREPFKKVKNPDEGIQKEGRGDITLLVHHVGRIANLLSIVMPHTSESILSAIATNTKPVNLFPRLEI